MNIKRTNLYKVNLWQEILEFRTQQMVENQL